MDTKQYLSGILMLTAPFIAVNDVDINVGRKLLYIDKQTPAALRFNTVNIILYFHCSYLGSMTVGLLTDALFTAQVIRRPIRQEDVHEW